MNKKHIQFLKKLRLENDTSQQEIADKLNISRPSYINIEQGKRELTLLEAETLASVFGFSIKDIESGIVPNYIKYKEMLLSIIRNASAKDGKIPKTKLAKLLYLADFAWFYEHLSSMSGMQYRRIQYGPVPDSYFRALDELEEEGKIDIDRSKDGIILISENRASKKGTLSTIKKDESDLIESISKNWKNKSTKEIVNFTHEQLPYKLCNPDEIIPYELITQEDPQYVY